MVGKGEVEPASRYRKSRSSGFLGRFELTIPLSYSFLALSPSLCLPLFPPLSLPSAPIPARLGSRFRSPKRRRGVQDFACRRVMSMTYLVMRCLAAEPK